GLALITAKWRTRTRAEIGALLGDQRGAGRWRFCEMPWTLSETYRDNYLDTEWPSLLDAHLVEICHHGRTDAENDEAQDRLCAATEAVWAKPCRTMDDLVLRAAIACHWNAPSERGEPAYPGNVISGSAEGYDALALA